MDRLFIYLINIYQKTPIKSHNSCIFIPTCSQYTKEAIIKYGSIKGIYLGFIRILQCNPWQKSRYYPLK